MPMIRVLSVLLQTRCAYHTYGDSVRIFLWFKCIITMHVDLLHMNKKPQKQEKRIKGTALHLKSLKRKTQASVNRRYTVRGQHKTNWDGALKADPRVDYNRFGPPTNWESQHWMPIYLTKSILHTLYGTLYTIAMPRTRSATSPTAAVPCLVVPWRGSRCVSAEAVMLFSLLVTASLSHRQAALIMLDHGLSRGWVLGCPNTKEAAGTTLSMQFVDQHRAPSRITKATTPLQRKQAHHIPSLVHKAQHAKEARYNAAIYELACLYSWQLL